MKRKTEELKRLKNMIDKDRFSFEEEFLELVNADISRVLGEYFDLRFSPKIVLDKKGEEIIGKIDFSARRIKSFGTIPK